MAEADNDGLFDDLDAFFSAAAKADAEGMQNAAQNVAGTQQGRQTGVRPKRVTEVKPAPAGQEPPPLFQAGTFPEYDTDDAGLKGKFVAVDPSAVGRHGGSDEPFVLIPANIHAYLPWWVWVAIGASLLMLAAGIFIVPSVNLRRMTARLGGNNAANVQSAMRQLVIRGDSRTIAQLYDMAMSPSLEMTARLRAVDTLGLMDDLDAERALLRIELASSTDATVRAAAVAARKQREASRTR